MRDSNTRERWLKAGLEVLATQGANSVRIDRIAGLVGLTKGSFHHHFDGAAGYKTALLARYEEQATEAIQRATSATARLPPEDALASLWDSLEATFDHRLEVAIRVWAFQDHEARATQQRIDELRLATLTETWKRVLNDLQGARTAALVPQLLSIGGTVVLPPIDRAVLREVFDLLADLIPEVIRRSDS